MKHQNRSLRIIGGKWRGRKVSFADAEEIRPTGDRVRETVFNWLMHDVTGANCLDLFAGSGILGIEALSRGANSITFVEKNAVTAERVSVSLKALGATDCTVSNTTASDWLENTGAVYDLIFVDPPFGTKLLRPVLESISSRGLCRGYVYVESDEADDFQDLPRNCTIHRQKRAGSVYFGLIRAG